EKPANHNARRADARRSCEGGASTAGNAMATGTKGRLIPATIGDNRAGTNVGSIPGPNCPPIPARNETGIRNFTEDASHNQYLTAARFFCRVSVNNQTAATKRVDCQRWFTKGAKI